MDDYLTQPVDRDELARKLNYWIGKHATSGNHR